VSANLIAIHIDLGFDIWVEPTLTLVPESALPAGEAAASTTCRPPTTPSPAADQHAEALVHDKVCRVFALLAKTAEGDKRWLGIVLYPVEGGWRSLADTLISEGLWP